MTSIHSRIEGALLGLLIGDALGVPYEFHPPDQLPPIEQLDFSPPQDFPRAHASVPPGTWSDDGAQALCLLDSLVFCGELNLRDFTNRMINWYEHGYMAVDYEVFDVGVQTASALRAVIHGTPIEQAGRNDERGNGNGSLMRVLPLALWHRGDDAALIVDARNSSVPTHPHLRSQLCCALYCLWIRNLLTDARSPWETAVSTLRTHITNEEPAIAELEFSIRPDDPPEGRGSGYVVDTLRSARMVFERDSYEAVVRAAVALGFDTDTTAAVAGGAAGARHGIDGIPIRWRQSLRGYERVHPLLEALLKRW